MKSAVSTGPDRGATFRDLFGVVEFRGLWLAQILSVAGDQLARVALTVLVYDRTRSALLAAVTFAAGVLPMFLGSLTLAGLADRFSRRKMMISTDVVSGLLMACMALPGVPLAILVALLSFVTMIGALFLAARAATYPDILRGDAYALGTAVTMTTVMFAQVAGFAVGGAVVAFLGVRVSLLADAATFGASALIIRTRVHDRPVLRARTGGRHGAAGPQDPTGQPRASWSPATSAATGLRLVFSNAALRTPMLFGWLSAFYELPEGVATPLAAEAHGGAVTVGLILAAMAFGSAAGALGFSRMGSAEWRNRLTGPLSIAACACLLPFAADPVLPGALLILIVSGLLGCYQVAANASFVQATSASERSQAFGIAQGGISLGQSAAIIVAGFAAQHVSADQVITASGGIGALCATALTLATIRGNRACR
jgi:predicted MFS family arabinose efflux permease